MSQENVEIVRAFFEPLARGDFSRWFDEVTDDFVFVTGPSIPDAGTYQGEAARDWIMAWVESFEGHTIEASDFIDGGDKVFFEIFQRGRPRGSEVPVEGRWWVVMTLRGAAVARAEVFDERSQALEAAGLRE
jgi:ketosteroid isomerase-like protein